MDYLSDNSGRGFFQIASEHEKLVPRYVLDAVIDKEAAAELADTDFADTVNRRFPLNSPADTWLSAAYLAKNAEQLRPVMRQHIGEQIKKAAVTWGIVNDVAAIVDAITQQLVEKVAAEDYGYADGKTKMYPLFSEHAVKLAGDHFAEHRTKYPLEMRRQIARQIMSKAASYGVTVPDCVRREAGYGMPRREVVAAELLERARYIKDAEVSAAVANLSELVATMPMDELYPALDKIAEIVEAADRTEGLNKLYGKKLMPIADTLFDIDPKTASALSEDAVELGPYVFSAAKLAELNPSVFSEVFGDDFVTRVTVDGKIASDRLADELNSAQTPNKNAFVRQLQQL